MDVNAWIIAVGGIVILIGLIWMVITTTREVIGGWRENHRE